MLFFSFSSTFSNIFIASSDSKFFRIDTMESDERNVMISDCTDSFSSTNIIEHLNLDDRESLIKLNKFNIEPMYL